MIIASLNLNDLSCLCYKSQPVSLSEFLEEWETQWFQIEDLMDMMDFDDTSDDDDSPYFQIAIGQFVFGFGPDSQSD